MATEMTPTERTRAILDRLILEGGMGYLAEPQTTPEDIIEAALAAAVVPAPPAPPEGEQVSPPAERAPVDGVEIVVNGQPVTVTAGPIRNVIAAAIAQSGQIGAPIEQWVLRTREGDVIPHELPGGAEYALTAGQRFFLHLGLPVPSPASAPITRQHSPECAARWSQWAQGHNIDANEPPPACVCGLGSNAPITRETAEAPRYWMIDNAAIARIQAVMQRLFTENRMNGDEMRDAAQTLASAICGRVLVPPLGGDDA